MLGLYRLQEGKILGFRLRENGVYIENHARGGRRLLEHILLRAPDIAALYGLKIRKKGTLLEKIIHCPDLTVNSCIINQYVGIHAPGIEIFHLHIHGGKRVL